MTPEEKAVYLMLKFKSSESEDGSNDVRDLHAANRCAIIAVNEIINSNPHSNPLNTEVYSTMDWWQEVKKELEKYDT
jgi:hypothetical protein